MDWEKLLVKETLSEEFLEMFLDRFDFTNICWNQALSEEFIRKHIDKVSWDEWEAISYSQTLSESFMEEFQRKLIWKPLCEKQKMSESFMMKMEYYMHWDTVFFYQDVSEEFKEKINKKREKKRNISFLSTTNIELDDIQKMMKENPIEIEPIIIDYMK